jgi:ankyrin repeat protein
MSALVRAARLGHVDIVKSLIAHGANLAASGDAAIIAAAGNGRIAAVQAILVKHSPRIEVLNAGLWQASNLRDVDAVRFLLGMGANPNSSGANLFTPLMIAAANGDLQTVKALVDAGAEIDKDRAFAGDPKPRNETACYWAIGIDTRISQAEVDAGRVVCAYLKKSGAKNCPC